MMTTLAQHVQKRQLALLLVLGMLLTAGWCWAATDGVSTVGVEESRLLKLTAGKSHVLDTPVPITRASIANPEVADTVVLSPRQLYVVGKSIGTTNLTLWDDHGKVLAIYDVEITPDLDRLREQLAQLLPDEKDVRIESTHDFVTLSGKVSDAGRLKEVLAIAEAYAPKKVINLLGVHRETVPPVVIDVIKGVNVGQVQF